MKPWPPPGVCRDMRLGIALSLILAACAPRAAKPPQSAAKPAPEPPVAEPVLEIEPLKIQVVPDGAPDHELDAYDARDLLDTGNEALANERYDEALAYYEQLLVDFPDSQLAVPAMFNAGLAHEGKGEVDEAIALYQKIVARREPGRDAIDAHLRMGALMAEGQRWADAIAAFESLLLRDDLTPTDRVEGLARLGYVLLEAKDYAGAEEVLRQALDYHATVSARAPLETDYYVAMAQYYLAQIPHRQFVAIPIRMPDKQTERDLEAKAELVILAHDRYLKTVDIGNPYWSTAAGYQLAHMRKQFWDQLVLAPIPPHLPENAHDFYVKRVHEEATVFLEQTLDTHQTNVRYADEAGWSTVWVEASRREAVVIAGILARESSGELVLPDAPAGDGLPTDPRPDYVPGRTEL